MSNRNQDLNKRLLIIGCGGHAKVVTDIAYDLGFKKIIYQDSDLEKKQFMGKNVFHQDFINFDDYFFVALGDNFLREKVTNEFQNSNPDAVAATLIHPTSYISKNCFIGKGSVVMPLCVINSSSEIGKGVIINTRSCIDHDNCLQDFSSVAPGVVTGGNVRIGYRSAISIGSVIKHGIIIGSDSIVGASSFVNKDICNKKTVYGSPANIIRNRDVGEKYL